MLGRRCYQVAVSKLPFESAESLVFDFGVKQGWKDENQVAYTFHTCTMFPARRSENSYTRVLERQF